MSLSMNIRMLNAELGATVLEVIPAVVISISQVLIRKFEGLAVNGKQFHKNSNLERDEGAALLETGILIACITLIAFSAVSGFGSELKEYVELQVSAVEGGSSSLSGGGGFKICETCASGGGPTGARRPS